MQWTTWKAGLAATLLLLVLLWLSSSSWGERGECRLRHPRGFEESVLLPKSLCWLSSRKGVTMLSLGVGRDLGVELQLASVMAPGSRVHLMGTGQGAKEHYQAVTYVLRTRVMPERGFNFQDYVIGRREMQVGGGKTSMGYFSDVIRSRAVPELFRFYPWERPVAIVLRDLAIRRPDVVRVRTQS